MISGPGGVNVLDYEHYEKNEQLIVEEIKRELFSEETCAEHRREARDFTRKRVLSFGRVVVLILSGHKTSLQNSLNKFFSALGELFKVPTASGYCQAKQKIRPEVFVRLNDVLCRDFYKLYGKDGEVKEWHGHRVLGADGTYLNLPDTAELRSKFSVHKNQHEGEKSEQVQALAVILHDLLNDIGVASAIGPSHQSEKSLIFDEAIWGKTRIGDLLVLDRNNADYTTIARASQAGRELVIRCPRQSFGVVNEFWKSTDRDRKVVLTIPQSAKTQSYVKENGLAESIDVRLLKFKLENGEEEVLLTTLCDRRKYRREEFYEVYGWRWRDETYYDRIKNIFEVERFSGQTEVSIKQDFYGVILLANLESVLSRDTEEEMQEEAKERGNETMPQVNHAVSYVALTGRMVNLLVDEKSPIEEIMKDLKRLFRTSPIRQRKGRKYKRETLTHARKLRYHRYTKRLIA